MAMAINFGNDTHSIIFIVFTPRFSSKNSYTSFSELSRKIFCIGLIAILGPLSQGEELVFLLEAGSKKRITTGENYEKNL